MTDQNESPDAPKKKIRWDIIAALYSIAGLLILIAGIISENNAFITLSTMNLAIAILILALNKRAKKKAAGE